MTTRHDFARLILHAGGWPGHANNFIALVSWMQAEGTKARFNPLATTRPEPGAVVFNSAGVRDYVSVAQGVSATVATLKNGRYAAIIASLHAASPAVETMQHVVASDWGTKVPNLAHFVSDVRAAWSTLAYKEA